MSDKSAPATQQLPPPLPSLLPIAINIHHWYHPCQPYQWIAPPHLPGPLNLAVNAEFHFLTCQILSGSSGSRSGEWLQKHHSKYHPTIPRPPAWCPCKIQQLRKGAGDVQTFWEVQNVEANSQPTLHPVPGGFFAQGTGTHTPSHPNSTGWLHEWHFQHSLPQAPVQVNHEKVYPPSGGSAGHVDQIGVYWKAILWVQQQLMDLLAVLCINGSEGRDALLLIHEGLFEVWTIAWTPQEDREIVDPTERCLALLTLRQDGSFKEPHDVIGIIAKFEYCMCLTFLQEIHHHIQADPQSDELEHCLVLENFFVEKTWSLKRWRQSWSRSGEEGILMGHDIRVEYDKIADDLINKDVGYSFLSDARNPQLTHQDQLVKKFLQDEATFAHFAMIREGTIIWNRKLTAMTYCNTQTQPTRNLAVLGKHISLLCRYLKTSTLTGKDKLIPHALDGITSDILVQDLALARPFAEVAARACFPDKPEVADLY
ncbi:hypothetical protein EDC04DRAFT_2616251 [Pisolithus marmoratus]|nr:hypothetical protein EDC04DRAFT_2616251 [Pisolithus marmoratus]